MNEDDATLAEIKILLPVIQIVAGSIGLDPLLIQAIVEHESGGNVWAVRYEPAWKWFVTPETHAARLGITADTEKQLQSMSLGPMQVMGAVARELGFKGLLTELLGAEAGINYGCLKLKSLLVRYGNEDDAISAYNQGSPAKGPDGLYLNSKTYYNPIAKRLLGLRTTVHF